MQLFLLGRRLMQIAETGLPRGKVAASLRLVLIDIAYHPGSSISEITERTGFPQSLVSMSVAKLRELGIVHTEPDPADRRRTLVRPTPRMGERARERGSSPIEAAIANQLGPEHEDQLGEVLTALDVLAGVLTPEVTTDGMRSAAEDDAERSSHHRSRRSAAAST